MSVAAAQADAFYREFLTGGAVFTVRDEGGYPAPMTRSGVRAQPFWSKKSRAQKIIDTVPAYAPFEIEEISALEFREEWLADLAKKGLAVGLNWSGKRAVGYDLSVADLTRNLDARAAIQHGREGAQDR